MDAIPHTMRGLVAPKYCAPTGWEIAELPVPSITKPNQILLRINAGAIMTGDCQRAGGIPILRLKPDFPLQIGAEGAGTVLAVGAQVTRFKPGDAVYGLNFTRPAFTEPLSGTCCEYAVVPEHVFLPKPESLPWEEAACLVGGVVTAYQAITQALRFMGADSLEGKTVYVPAALSGTGTLVIQVAKNMFGAARIISTASTPKMKLVEQLMPGMVDQLVDYTKENVADVVTRGSVDVMINTQWNTLTPGIPLLNPQTGVLVSLTGAPESSLLKALLGEKAVPFWLAWATDLAQYWYAFQLRGTNIRYKMISGNPEIREDMDMIGEAIALGKIKAVYRAVDLSNLDEMRAECTKVSTGRGGVGKLVVRVKDA